jgi:putative phage-type endonuclease
MQAEEKSLQQGTPEWLEMRKDCIGASDAPIIMGVSPWTTPYELWTYKMGLAEPKMNSAMRRGSAMEEDARQAFNKEHNVLVTPKVYFHSDYRWMMASFDGQSQCKMVEIKCPGKEDHEIALKGQIPEKYFPQLQHQILVGRSERVWYFSYRSPTDYISIPVESDDDYIEKMLEAEKEFYRCMIEFTPPPLTERDYVNMESNKEFERASLVYLNAVKLRKEAEENEEWSKKRMIEQCGNRNAKNKYLKMTKSFRKGAIQYDKIEVLKRIDLEQYRKAPIESYRITEVKNGSELFDEVKE